MNNMVESVVEQGSMEEMETSDAGSTSGETIEFETKVENPGAVGMESEEWEATRTEEDEEETCLTPTLIETVLEKVVEEDAEEVERRKTAVEIVAENIVTQSGLLLNSLDQTSVTKTKAQCKSGGQGSREKREAEIRLKSAREKEFIVTDDSVG